MRWSPADIADAVAAGLKARAAEDDLEQAVYGFDSLDELGLHPLIHRSLRAAGFGVWPEQRYPGDHGRPRRSEGRRCDMALTENNHPLREEKVKDTLFDRPDAVDPQDAYWLEVKLVAQFEAGGPFRRYAAELLSPVADDVKKLWSDGMIRHGGLLLLLLTADHATGEHDLLAWHRRCLERGFPVAAPATRGFAITDRIGNGYCTLGVFGVRGV